MRGGIRDMPVRTTRCCNGRLDSNLNRRVNYIETPVQTKFDLVKLTRPCLPRFVSTSPHSDLVSLWPYPCPPSPLSGTSPPSQCTRSIVPVRWRRPWRRGCAGTDTCCDTLTGRYKLLALKYALADTRAIYVHRYMNALGHATMNSITTKH